MPISPSRSTSSLTASRWTTPLPGSTLLVALGGIGSLLVLSLAERPASAETLYLATLSLPALLAMALGLESRWQTELAWGILGFVALLWFIPTGSSRLAAATTLLFIGGLVVARTKSNVGTLRTWLAVALALTALRILWRPQLLAPLPTTIDSVLQILLPAVATTLALWVLQRHRGAAATALALGSVGLLCGGLTKTVATVCLLLAAGEALARFKRSASPSGVTTDSLAALSLATFAAAGFWETRLTVIGFAAALATLSPSRWAWVAPTTALVATSWLIPTPAALLPLQTGWILWILLPTVTIPRALNLGHLAAGLALGFLGLLLFPGIAGLALAVGWVVLRLDREVSSFDLQAAWLTWIAALATLLAALPWGRNSPLLSALELVGGAVQAVTAIGIAVVALGLFFLMRVNASLQGRTFQLVALSALVALLVTNHGPTRSVLEISPFQIDRVQPIRNFEIEPIPLQHLTIDTTATHAAELSRGTVLAHLELRDEGGELLERVPLRVGLETGDWTGLGTRLEAWQTGLGPTGDLSRTYRANWSWPTTKTPVGAIRLVRSVNLFDAVELVIRRIEVSP